MKNFKFRCKNSQNLFSKKGTTSFSRFFLPFFSISFSISPNTTGMYWQQTLHPLHIYRSHMHTHAAPRRDKRVTKTTQNRLRRVSTFRFQPVGEVQNSLLEWLENAIACDKREWVELSQGEFAWRNEEIEKRDAIFWVNLSEFFLWTWISLAGNEKFTFMSAIFLLCTPKGFLFSFYLVFKPFLASLVFV